MATSQDKPNFLVYAAWLGVYAVAINTVYLILPNEHLKWYLLGILVVAVMTGFILSNRHYTTIGIILDIAGLVVFVYFAFQIYENTGSFGTYLGEMLTMMLVLRCFKLFRKQDFIFPLTISLTLMVFTAIPSFSAGYVYSLLGFLLMIGIAMFLGSVDEFARLPRRSKRHSHLKYTYDFLEDYAPVPVSNKPPRQLARYLGLAIGATVPVVLFSWIISSSLYFTVDHTQAPGTEIALLGAFGSTGLETDPDQETALLTGIFTSGQAQYYGGFGTEFNIAQGRLIENSTSTEVVMEVESNLQSYWRGKCFDIYTGRGWTQSEDITTATWSLGAPNVRRSMFHAEYGPELRNDGIEADPDTHREQIDQVYHLKTDLPGIIFTAYQAREILMPVPGVRIDDTFTIVPPDAGDSMVAGQTYEVMSMKFDFAGGVHLNAFDYNLHELAEDEPEFFERYTQLPEKGTMGDRDTGYNFTRIRAKAYEITAGADTVYERVNALLRFLKSSYNYSLNPPSAVPPELDAIDYFLFSWDPRRGHCEYFSTSLAILCRSIGIPARIVTGYSTGNYSLLKNLYIVQERHAHAWVEIFWPELGWVEFDPTPQSWVRGFGEQAAGRWLMLHNMVENLYIYDPIGQFRTKIFPAVNRVITSAITFVKQRELDFYEFVDPIISRQKANRDGPLWLLVASFSILLLSYVSRRVLNPDFVKNHALAIGSKSLKRVRKILIRNGVRPDRLATEMDCVIHAGLMSHQWGEAVGKVADGYQYILYSGRKIRKSDVSNLKHATRQARRSPA